MTSSLPSDEAITPRVASPLTCGPFMDSPDGNEVSERQRSPPGALMRRESPRLERNAVGQRGRMASRGDKSMETFPRPVSGEAAGVRPEGRLLGT
ncbi:hypothetical protein EYF80_052459 [Liparis tanakae]|uniref:Uncharacterized protein n=1 Tax=Liparis tanakae TaxID=230148 RepID=A0A4Z2F9A1_9TELE|nr:hypothetical protein EYF80_052459 [Liparis tanakae]